MTCNQMILLLQCYRGLPDTSCGTHASDKVSLTRSGYLVPDTHNLTGLAKLWVDKCLSETP